MFFDERVELAGSPQKYKVVERLAYLLQINDDETSPFIASRREGLTEKENNELGFYMNLLRGAEVLEPEWPKKLVLEIKAIQKTHGN
jgi:hypothetical protein